MDQTDKTDKTARATTWSVTAWKEEIAICRDGSRFPNFVERVDGQTETCPKTNTIHFQGLIKCSRQVRMSALKSWLPSAHLEPAKSVPALKTYIKKTETSNGDYGSTANEMPHFAPEEVLRMLGDAHDQIEDMERFVINNKFNSNAYFFSLVDTIVEEKGDKYVRLFMNPILKTLFLNMKVWKKKRAEPLVLQAQPDGEEEDDEIYSPDDV